MIFEKLHAIKVNKVNIDDNYFFTLFIRFYSLHTFVLPLLTAVFMLMHFSMIRKQGISGPL